MQLLQISSAKFTSMILVNFSNFISYNLRVTGLVGENLHPEEDDKMIVFFLLCLQSKFRETCCGTTWKVQPSTFGGGGRKEEGIADQKQVLCNLEKLPSIAELRPGQQNCQIITDLSSQQNQEEETAFCTETWPSYMLLGCENQRGKEIYFMFSRDPKV